ncbi:MAG TPA: hypothetical protein VIS30_00070 [Candidatus Deferrimicrobiaceae bacterium]
MAKFTGGDRVFPGAYWNPGTGGLITVQEEEVLPGDDRSVYYRVPFVLLFPMGVVLGALYVAALPLASIGAAAAVLGKRLFGDLLSRAKGGVSFGWRPTEAYLAGKELRREGTEPQKKEPEGKRQEERGRNNSPRK